MAEQAEAGDVGHARALAAARGGARRRRVERGHHRDGAVQQILVGARAALARRRDRAYAERLGQHERRRPGRRRALVSSSSGCTMPVTASPYFGSGSSMEWPPDDRGARRAPPRPGRPRGSRRSTSIPSRSSGKATTFSAVSGVAAHRVDVGERVGRGDPAEVIRVVDDRREEVDRLHERELVGELEHRGVVGGGGADEQPLVGGRAQLPDDREQRRGGKLAPTARAVAERGEGVGRRRHLSAARLSSCPVAPPPARPECRRARSRRRGPT